MFCLFVKIAFFKNSMCLEKFPKNIPTHKKLPLAISVKSPHQFGHLQIEIRILIQEFLRPIIITLLIQNQHFILKV